MQAVLITGASSGIGLTIANKLHDNGFKVYGTSRFPDWHRDKLRFELLPLDITSENSIQNCIESLLSKSPTIDALINNAGFGISGSAEETSRELAEKQFQINFWGAVNMAKAVLPIMRQQKDGKIITVSSLAGLVSIPFQSYYSASKHALEGFFRALRFEVRRFNIHVSMIEPTFYRTNLGQTLEYAEPTISDYDTVRDNALEVYANSINNACLPDPVAKTVLKILRSKKPAFRNPVGGEARILPLLQFMFPGIFERGAIKRFKV